MKPRYSTSKGVPYDVFATEDPGVIAVVTDPETSPVAFYLRTKGSYYVEELGGRELDLTTVAQLKRIPEGKRTHKADLWMTCDFETR